MDGREIEQAPPNSEIRERTVDSRRGKPGAQVTANRSVARLLQPEAETNVQNRGGEADMKKTINRRALLKRGAALAGGLAFTFGASMAAAAESTSAGDQPTGASNKQRTFFALATTREDQDRACARHAANKLFASPEAADQHRAHPGCNCQVVKGGDLPESTWVELFGSPASVARVAVDRRWGWVAQTLKTS